MTIVEMVERLKILVQMSDEAARLQNNKVRNEQEDGRIKHLTVQIEALANPDVLEPHDPFNIALTNYRTAIVNSHICMSHFRDETNTGKHYLLMLIQEAASQALEGIARLSENVSFQKE